MRQLRYRLEYACLWTALCVIRHLSFSRAVRLATAVARLAFRFDHHHRETACRNILRSGITSDAAEARRIARASFEHFATLAIEVLKSKEFLTSENWPEHAEYVAEPQLIERIREPGAGMILVSAHLGNWEIGGELLSFTKPAVAIVRNMNNPYTDRLIRGTNPRPNFQWIPKHAADPHRLVRVVRRGHVLVIVGDQHARQAGMWVDFFGTPASTHTTPAVLHLLTGATLMFGCCVRTAPQRYQMRVSEVRITPTGNRDADVRAILEELNRKLEDEIRRYPEQYLWAHRRWRPPPDEAAESADSEHATS